MKIYAVCGSPRKNGNSVQLVKAFMDGVQEAAGDAAETEVIYLSDLKYTGCRGCFACKMNNDRLYGHCAAKDDLTPVIEKIIQADGIVFASPIYFSHVSSYMQALFERLMFPFNSYEEGWKKIAPKRFETAMIYTMNRYPEQAEKGNYREKLGEMEHFVEAIFSKPDVISAYGELPFGDLSRYRASAYQQEKVDAYLAKSRPANHAIAFQAGKAMVERIIQKESVS